MKEIIVEQVSDCRIDSYLAENENISRVAVK